MQPRTHRITAFVRQAPALIAALLLLLVASRARAADIGWINSAGGNFSEATNWSTGTVPGAGDNAFITQDGSYTVTLDNSTTLASLTLGGNGSQTLALPGSLSASSVTINPTGVLNHSGGTLNASTTLLGVDNWSAGTIEGTFNVLPGARLNMGVGSSNKYVEGTLNNSGLVFWSNTNGNDNVYGGGNFNNLAAGVFNNAAPLAFYHSMQAAFNNSGTVNGLSGQLDIYGGGISTGAFNAVDPGALLSFSGGKPLLNTGASFGGPGNVRVINGTVLVQGNVSCASNFGLSGGTIAGAGTLTIGSGGSFSWTSGTIGSDDASATNGAITIATGARLNIGAGSSNKYLEGTLNNSGLVFWSNANSNDNIYGDGNFNNLAAGVFNNAAALSSYHSMQVAFNNAGAVNAVSGQLDIYKGGNGRSGISTGVFNVGANNSTSLSFSSGQHVLNTGARFTGGVARIIGGSVLLQGNASINGTLEMAGGTLLGPGTLTVASGGSFNWKSGTIGSDDASITNGAVTIATGGRLNISSGSFNKYLEGTLNNSGVGTWKNANGNDNIYGEGTFNNLVGGVFNNAAGLASYHSMQVAFNNAGTVNGLSGQLDFYGGSGGQTGTSKGLFSTARSALITFSYGQHIFNAGARLGGAGTVRISGGTIVVQGATSVVGKVELTGGIVSGPAPLTVAMGGSLNLLQGGNLTLAGALNVGSGGTLNYTSGTLDSDSDSDSDATGLINILRGGSFNLLGRESKALGRNVVNSGITTFVGSGGLDGFDGRNISFTNATGGVLNTARGTSTIADINVINSGTISPGGAGIGTLAITGQGGEDGGDFTQTATGTLAIQIGGVASTSTDRITVEARAALSGTVTPVLLGSFAPTTGTRFTFLSAPRRSGAFLRVVGSPLSGGRVVALDYPAGHADLLISIAPTVTSISPARGVAGTIVTVNGTNFTDASRVSLGDTPVLFSRVSPTLIRFTVPVTASSGKVTVINPGGGGTSTAIFIVVPTIKSFTATSGPVATSVLITGANLNGATSVKFNGRDATFTRISATQIRATVPAGATTGRISITTPGGVATSSGVFTVTPPPSIPRA